MAETTETKAGEGDPMAERTETKAGEGEAMAERTETKAGEGEATAERTEAKAGEGEATAGKTEAKAGEGEVTAGKTEGKAGEGEGEATAGKTEAKAGDGEATAGKTEAKAGEGEATAGKTEAKADEGEATAGEGVATAGKTEAKAGEGEATAGKTEAKAGDGEATAGKTEAKAGDGEAMAGRTEKKGSEGGANFVGFLEAMKEEGAGSDSGVEKAFRALSQGGATGPITAEKLREGLENQGVKLTTEDVNGMVVRVKSGWKDGEHITCQELKDIVTLAKVTEFVKAGEARREETFKALSHGGTTCPITTDVLRQAMELQGINFTAKEIAQIFAHVKSDWKDGDHITCQQFQNIVNVAKVTNVVKAIDEKGGLEEKAFERLSHGGTTCPITTDVLRWAMEIQGVDLTTNKITGIVTQINSNWKDGHSITFQEFKDIVSVGKVAGVLKALAERGGAEGEKAFQVLSQGGTSCSITVDVLCSAMKTQGVNFITEEIAEVLVRTKHGWKDGDHLTFQEFKHTVNVAMFVGCLKSIKEHRSEEEAFQTLSRFGTTDPIDPDVLRRAMEIHGINLSTAEVRKIIDLMKSDWKDTTHISPQEFRDIAHVAKFVGVLKAMKDEIGSEERAFRALLSDGETSCPVTVDVLRLAMEIWNPNIRLTTREVYGITGQVDRNKGITFAEFKLIYEKMTERDKSIKQQMEEIWKQHLEKILNEVTRKEDSVVLYGEAGVGKTWMAKKLADRAFREAPSTTATATTTEQEDGTKQKPKPRPKRTTTITKTEGGDDTDGEDNKKPKPLDYVLWMYPQRSYEEGLTFEESIAHQLFLMLPFHKSEAEYAAKYARDRLMKKTKDSNASAKSDKEKEEEEEEEEKKEKHNKQERLKQMIRDAIKGKKLLLVYDDLAEQGEGSEPFVLEERLGQINWEKRLEPTVVIKLELTICKLITRRSKGLCSLEQCIEVTPWTWDEARESVMAGIRDDNDNDGKVKELADFFISKTKKLPAEILIIKKTMSYLLRQAEQCKYESGLHTLQTIRDAMKDEHDVSKIFPKLITECKLIPKSILIDCYSVKTRDTHFLRRGSGQRGMVNYNELISHWIIEGYLGPFVSFQDQYAEGYRVFTNHLECGLLRKLEDSYVAASTEMKFDFDSLEYNEFYGNVVLGMGNTFNCKFGKIALADGIMRTVAGRQEEDKLRGEDKIQEENLLRDEELKAGTRMTTLMLDGNHLEIPDKSFFTLSPTKLSKKGILPLQLENLAVFYPTVKPFPLPLKELKKLRLLVLRGCKYLEKFHNVITWTEQDNNQKPAEKSLSSDDNFPTSKHNNEKNSKAGHHTRSASAPSPSLGGNVPARGIFDPLEVLEISGPSPLDELPGFIFERTTKLKSINLSGLAMTYLPDSFYKLSNVEYLILRGCPKLKLLKSLENFKKLEVLDASGSIKLERFAQKNFKPNQRLLVVNFSRTFLDRIPLISSLPRLESLILSDCPDLRGIRKVDQQQKLRVLNIAGAVKVEEFIDPIINNLDRIDLLDLSRTAMRRLPGRVGNPRSLLMINCPKLKELLPITDLNRVENLDVSGSSKLEIINKNFTASLRSLRRLNLSKTGIVELPPLHNSPNLQHLFLSDCKSLKKLDGLSDMKKLEELDLSGCNALEEMKDNLFENLSELQKLSLCRLQLKKLPELSWLKKLKILNVEDCPNVDTLPKVEECPNLEKLNYSGTTLKSQPFRSSNHTPTIVPSWDVSEPQKFLQELDLIDEPNVDEAGKIDPSKEDLDQCNWKIKRWAKGIYVKGTDFLRLSKKLHEKCFSKSIICIVPLMDGRVELPDKSSYDRELKLRCLYIHQVSKTDNMVKSGLEIRGFIHAPNCVQPLLEEASSIVLIDNPFLKCLCGLGCDGVKAMKLCWIEKCNEMEYLITSKAAGGKGSVFADSFQNLEILWFSHAMKLKKVSDGDIPEFRFRRLTTLYLEFCPELSSISSFQMLETLETLFIRNCKNLETLSKEDDKSDELKSLTELHLWGLPKLKEIKLKAPSLKKMRVGGCCQLKYVLSSIQGGYDALETLEIKSCEDLNTICENSDLSTCSPKLRELELWALPKLPRVSKHLGELRSLKVGECHSLENLMESNAFPSKLETLEVKSCEKLEVIVGAETWDEEGGREEGSRMKKLELMCLPELVDIDRKKLPSEKNECMIWGCPKIEKQIEKHYAEAAGESSGGGTQSNDGGNTEIKN